MIFLKYFFNKCQHFIDTYWGLSLSLSFSLTVHYCALFWPFLHSIILRCGRVKSGLNLSLTSCWRTNSSCMLFSFQITLSEGTFSLFLFPNLAQHLVFIPYPFYCVTLFGIVSTFLNFFFLSFYLFIYFSLPRLKKEKEKEKKKKKLNLLCFTGTWIRESLLFSSGHLGLYLGLTFWESSVTGRTR